jgi:hypothetical protein
MIWGARLWVTAVDGRRPWGLSSAALLAMQQSTLQHSQELMSTVSSLHTLCKLGTLFYAAASRRVQEGAADTSRQEVAHRTRTSLYSEAPRGSKLAFTLHCRCEMQALRQFRDLPHIITMQHVLYTHGLCTPQQHVGALWRSCGGL